MIDTFATRLGGPRSEGGFALLEVLISALLVAVIAVGTYSGLISSNRATADERTHAQATTIAQQDEERLRGLTVAQLDQIPGSETHTVAENGICIEEKTGSWYYYSGSKTKACEAVSGYSGKYTGTDFTVTSSIKFVSLSSEKEALTCETSGGTTDYIQTNSSVKWPAMGSRAPVSQSSLVDVPTQTSLLVKVVNQNNEAVPGATVELSSTKTQQTTPTSGCVIFGGLNPEATVVSVSKTGWVNVNGKSPSTESVTPTENKTTSRSYQIGDAGAIDATFVEKENGPLAKADAFVASQSGIESSPQFMLEGTISPSASSASTDYTESITSPATLFPFVKQGTPPGNNPYTVYAGYCTENNPTKQIATFANATAQVNPGETATLSKPLLTPPVKITVYTGTSSTKQGEILSSGTASLTPECSSFIPVNYTSPPSYTNYQPVTAGHLTYPGTPFGKFTLCVSGTISGSNKKWSGTFTNNKESGPSSEPNNGGESGGYGIIYLGSGTSGTC